MKEEKKELMMQMENITEDEESERCFIEAALEDLKVRIPTLIRAAELGFGAGGANENFQNLG